MTERADIPNRDLAIAAAHAATEGAAELLRYAREGDCATSFALEPETLERLADALKMAIEVELPAADRRATENDPFPADLEGRELLGQLHAGLARFLEGWA